MSRDLDALLDELYKDATEVSLTDLFMKKNDIFEWMSTILYSFSELPLVQRNTSFTVEEWSNPKTALELYIMWVYEPTIKEEVYDDN